MYNKLATVLVSLCFVMEEFQTFFCRYSWRHFLSWVCLPPGASLFWPFFAPLWWVWILLQEILLSPGKFWAWGLSFAPSQFRTSLSGLPQSAKLTAEWRQGHCLSAWSPWHELSYSWFFHLRPSPDPYPPCPGYLSFGDIWPLAKCAR